MAEHYFTQDPSSAEQRQAVSARIWGHDLTFDSATGVFAAGRLDRGTAVLFRAASPPAAAGTFLDLGCGYGVIACALAMAVPGGEVWAVDVNERALRLTAASAAGSCV